MHQIKLIKYFNQISFQTEWPQIANLLWKILSNLSNFRNQILLQHISELLHLNNDVSMEFFFIQKIARAKIIVNEYLD